MEVIKVIFYFSYMLFFYGNKTGAANGKCIMKKWQWYGICKMISAS